MVISNLHFLFYLIASLIFIKELIIFLKKFIMNYPEFEDNNDKDEFIALKGKKLNLVRFFFFVVKYTKNKYVIIIFH